MTIAEGGPVTTEPALRVTNLSKTYGGTRALIDIDLEARNGEIHALVGGNGSGKSTLIRVLAGVTRADPGGTLTTVDGTVPAPAWNPARAFAAKMRFVHQNPGIFGDLTVAENIAIGHGFPTSAGRIQWRALRERTAQLLARFEIRATPDTPVGALAPADRTMVAVARALQDVDAASGGLLVLDEPTTSLPAGDIEVLLAALRRCAAQGQTILYVSHRVDEVLALADRVTVLRDGRRVVTQPASELTESALIELIAGRAVSATDAVAPTANGEVAVELRGLSAGRLHDVDLRVNRGEIVGIAGLLGSGRSTLLRAIFGSVRPDAGEISIGGVPLHARDAGAAIAAGVAYVPEDRNGEAVFAAMTVRENISAGGVSRYWRGLRLQHADEQRDAVAAMNAFLVRAPSDRVPMATLSGGNQQKVVLARWLRRQPRVLLLDEPTQGVDVGARQEIYDLIRRSADAGAAVIVVANDFDELVRLCGRVVVLRDGRVVGEEHAPSLDAHRLTELAYRTEAPA